jgi:hypothetical protein
MDLCRRPKPTRGCPVSSSRRKRRINRKGQEYWTVDNRTNNYISRWYHAEDPEQKAENSEYERRHL